MAEVQSTPASAPPQRTGACGDCRAPFVRRTALKKYCEACSRVRDLMRKKRYNDAHPPTGETNRRRAGRAKSRVVAAGMERNRPTALNLAWAEEPVPPPLWYVRFAVPFDYAASKNHIYTRRAEGHVALRREGRTILTRIAESARLVMGERRAVQAKVYVDILVQKPDHRGDAINVIDTVCDGLKLAVGVDDRWFCIRRMDWQIVKDGPCIVIGFGQADGEHQQVCSHCGIIQPLGEFRRKPSAKLGVERVCRSCYAAARGRPLPTDS